MSGNNTGSTIWEAAKQEWTKHICNLLVPIVEEGFRTIYANCERSLMPRRTAAATTAPEEGDNGAQEEQSEEEMPAPDQVGVMSAFQQTLKNIPKWNLDIVDQEYARILKQLELEDCSDVLDDLVKAAFTSHILILTSVNLSGKANKKVEMNIPSSKRFIHKIYIESARVFFRNPHLFVKSFENVESEYRYHKNSSRIEAIICGSVEEAIRKLMPIKTILKAYLNAAPEEANDEVLDEVEDITRRVSPRSKRGLRGILKSYIETTSEVIKQPGAAEITPPPKSILKQPQKRRDEDEEDERSVAESHDEHEKEPRDDSNEHRSSGEEEEVVDHQSEEDDYEQDDITIQYSGGGSNRRDSLIDRRVSPERSDRMMKRPDEGDDRRGRRLYDRSESKRDYDRDRDRDHHRRPYEDDKEPEIHIERKPRDRQKSIEFRLEKDDDEDVDNTKKRVAYKAPSHMAFFPDVNDDGDVIDEDEEEIPSPEEVSEESPPPPTKHRSSRPVVERRSERRESRPVVEKRESRPVEKRESRPVEKRESRPVEKRESRPVEKRDRRPPQVEKREVEKRDKKSSNKRVIDSKKRK